MRFPAFQKVPRLSRPCVITEKIDGTNALIAITDLDMELDDPDAADDISTRSTYVLAQSRDPLTGQTLFLRAGNRNRWLKPDEDNFGFAAWAQNNAAELFKLGYGTHYGEWWGQGIQRRYGMDRKVFSLFNTSRWNDPEVRPACCSVVPTLYAGPFEDAAIKATLGALRELGSRAAPGFMHPEGIVIYHTAAGTYFKKTLVGDDSPKGRPE